MFYPSLTMFVGALAFLAAAIAAKRAARPQRICAWLAAGFAALAAFQLAAQLLSRAGSKGWPIGSELHVTTENGSYSSSTAYVGWEMAAVLAALALAFALLTRLQAVKQAAYYPRLARAAAPALALPLVGTEPLIYGAPYIFGLIPFEFALPVYKILGITGAALLLIFSLALILMLLQIIFSFIRAWRRPKPDPT